MFAQLTAFEMLVSLLVVCFLAALAGWAGGFGGRLMQALRIQKLEAAVLKLTMTGRGAAGQAQTQVTRARLPTQRRKLNFSANSYSATAPRQCLTGAA
jgi:hypothetical protein